MIRSVKLTRFDERQSIIISAMGTKDAAASADEIIEDLYWFIERFETRQHALNVLESAVADPSEADDVRKLWRAKRPQYILHFQQGADQLLLVANKVFVLGNTVKAETSALEKLSKRLSYRPYEDKPPTPPTANELQEAIECAERVRAACHLSPIQEHRVSSSPADVQTELATLTERQRDFLKAAFRLKAMDASNPKLAKQILREVDPQLDLNSYKHQFSFLKKKGLFNLAARGCGYFLSEAGRGCAALLE